MCCRFYIKDHDSDFAQIVDGAEKSGLYPRVQKAHPAPLVRAGEVRPTDVAAVLAMDKQQKPTLFPMIWGFTTPGRNVPIINARSESAAEKPLFREAWQKHCQNKIRHPAEGRKCHLPLRPVPYRKRPSGLCDSYKRSESRRGSHS